MTCDGGNIDEVADGCGVGWLRTDQIGDSMTAMSVLPAGMMLPWVADSFWYY